MARLQLGKPSWSPGDWSLEALHKAIYSPDSTSESWTPGRYSALEVVPVATFQRPAFRMCALDDSSDDEDDERKKEGEVAFVESPQATEERVTSGAAASSSTCVSVGDLMKLEESFLALPAPSAEAALDCLERQRYLKVQEAIRNRREAVKAQFERLRREGEANMAKLKASNYQKLQILRNTDDYDNNAIADLRESHLTKVTNDHLQRRKVNERRIREKEALERAQEEDARREAVREERRLAEARRKAEEEVARRAREAEEEARAEAKAKAKQEAEEARARQEVESARLQAEAAAAAAERRRMQQLMAAKASSATPVVGAPSPPAKAWGPTTVAKSALSGVAAGSVGGRTEKDGALPRVKVTERAAQAERLRLETMERERADAQPFESNDSLKKERKMLERKVILHLQQISATQEQVRRKTGELVGLLCDTRLPQHFLSITLGAKLMSQCEVQVQKLPQFAFPLAQVTVDLAVKVPKLMDVVLAHLHKTCIYTVPKHFVFTENTTAMSDEEYYRCLGYRMEDGALESTDSFVGRMVGYVTFYAAITQTDPSMGAPHPHGLSFAWAWCAGLLKKLPPNRTTASTLEAFLRIAGYRLHQAYPKPFMKLLHTILRDFVGALKHANKADARAAITRIETYAHMQKFLTPPEGRNMPLTDESSRVRA